jgi:phospholipase C
MMNSDRRTFLRVLGGTALAASLPDSIARAMAIPAHNRTGTIQDVEHIVVLMQENRSFDHLYGSLRGVRGYDDPRAVTLPSGQPVWYQPGGVEGAVLPFHPTAPDMGLQFLQDLPHDWTTTHAAWNEGYYDQWIPAKGTTTMAYLVRADIPFHYALADAFTICDAYHSSLLGATDPNRYYMWTGWVGNDGSGGGPVVDNAEVGYGWSTFPEVLEAAGISWKVYQDVGTGLTAAGSWGWTSDPYIGNYGDNSLLYFHQYQNALPGSALYEKAKTGTDISAGGTLFDVLKQDVRNNTLPQVSWIVAPEAYSEHPNWPVNYGAWYVSQVLDTLTSNPDLWSKTVLLITYDENDGFFDHVVPANAPPTAAQGLSTVTTANEIFPGDATYPAGQYGLGVRVPMTIVSPWSKGGYVCSEVFDHTSIIRFIEQRFGPGAGGLPENNITPWRKTVCGDLTSAFNFKTPNAAPVPLPSTAGYIPPDNLRHADYDPVPPLRQAVPAQEKGQRYARAIDYEFDATGRLDLATGTFTVRFTNNGKLGVCFQVRGVGLTLPLTYTVEAGKSLTDSWTVEVVGLGAYDLSVYGPNGFFRRFKGGIAGRTPTDVELSSSYDARDGGLGLVLINQGRAPKLAIVTDAYSGRDFAQLLAPGESVGKYWSLQQTSGWYDLTLTVEGDGAFSRHLAGHVETGRDSVSDPAIGARSKPHVQGS